MGEVARFVGGPVDGELIELEELRPVIYFPVKEAKVALSESQAAEYQVTYSKVPYFKTYTTDRKPVYLAEDLYRLYLRASPRKRRG